MPLLTAELVLDQSLLYFTGNGQETRRQTHNVKFQLSINMAMTLDGKVARPDGKWYGLSSRNDKKRMDLIRSQADALILGKTHC